MGSPMETARSYPEIGRAKVSMSPLRTLLLAILAGMFIALAGVGATFGNVYGNKIVGAAVFPAGLAMVIIAGSELFTGNCLLIIPVLEKAITVRQMLRNWALVYAGNLIGAVLIAAMTVGGGTFDGVYDTVIATAAAKAALPLPAALLRGILCNILVCLAVWMAMAAKDVAGKIAGLYFPIFLFVLCGFEHCVANMFYLPAGVFAAARCGVSAENLTVYTMCIGNLLPVTLGNIIGGCAVGLVYRTVYLREK